MPTALALALSLLAQSPALSQPGLTTARPMQIYFIDVDGGAATLVVTPEGESVLIDSGWPGRDDRDPRRIEAVVRNEAKLDHLDHLVTTHWHTDHFGGVEGLSKRLRIDHFWDRGLPDPTAPDGDKANFPDGPAANDPQGLAYRKASEGKRSVLRAGGKLPLRGGAVADVLAASGAGLEGTYPLNRLAGPDPIDLPEDRSDNARSIVLRFHLGQFDFLDCGDLTWNTERSLVRPTDTVGPIDLYQVTHHGLDISNHPTLLATIAPTVTVMNNGPRKGGSPATVRRLRAVPSIQAAYQLHKNQSADLLDNTDPALIANPPGTSGQFIRVVVAPTGDTFTVGIGPDGPTREFAAH